MEPYLILCCFIKHDKVGISRGKMQMCIILEELSTKNSKYSRDILQPFYIIDKTANDLILKQIFFVNALVNL